MKPPAVRVLQRRLQREGLYTLTIDGIAGSQTDAAVAQALSERRDRLPPDWENWPDRRKRVACLQLLATEAGVEAGPVDGLWGPQTAFAADALSTIERTGVPPETWRDAEIGPLANPNLWPGQSHDELTAFFGSHGVLGGRTPELRIVNCPYPLKLSWQKRTINRNIRCHSLVAESLERVLLKIWSIYSHREISSLRLDVFGGCYAPRKMRGGSRQSTHSWAIALDFDPEHNRLNWGRDRARLARAEYDPWWQAWEDEGWYSLGRRRNFDWMHIQATS